MSLPSASNLPSVSGNKEAAASTNVQSTNLDDRPTTSGNQITDTNKPALLNRRHRRGAQFTRGEKCLFIHLVATFGLLLLLFIVYLVHSYWVHQHDETYDMFGGMLKPGPGSDVSLLQATGLTTEDVSRCVINVIHPRQHRHLTTAVEKSDYMPVGVVYVLPDYYMCNSLLLRPKWSLAPAHCVAARSDPDLAYALPSWRIIYGRNNDYNTNEKEKYMETMITRSVPHPHFNRDDFQNNIGLFEHDSILVFSYASINDVSLNDDILMKNAADLRLVDWEDSWELHGHAVQNAVQPLSSEKCKQYVSPVLDSRAYEYCVTLTASRNVTIAPGAVLVTKTGYLGMFAWGDSSGQHLPFVILDFANYKNWILHIISIYAV